MKMRLNLMREIVRREIQMFMLLSEDHVFI